MHTLCSTGVYLLDMFGMLIDGPLAAGRRQTAAFVPVEGQMLHTKR